MVDKKIMFIHLPRTGGTFLRKLFSVYDIPHFNHFPVSELSPRKDYYAFGFIRNPFDWYVSRYYWFCKKPALEKGPSTGNDMGLLHNFSRRIKDVNEHIKRGVDTDGDGFWFTGLYHKMYCYNQENIMDRICYFENLKEEVRDVLICNGIDPVGLDYFWEKKMYAKNSTVHKPWQDLLTQESIDIIKEKDKKIFKEYYV